MSIGKLWSFTMLWLNKEFLCLHFQDVTVHEIRSLMLDGKNVNSHDNRISLSSNHAGDTPLMQKPILRIQPKNWMHKKMRISFTPSTTTDFPFHMTRRQFSIRQLYAMMINKAHEQSVRSVEVDFSTPVFSHG